MSKRVVVITGGGTGMGKASALKFAEQGDTVYILGRRKEKLNDVAGESDHIHGLVCDVTDPEEVEQAKARIIAKERGIDVLVNNAGGTIKAEIDNPTTIQTLEFWRSIIAKNLDSAFIVLHSFQQHVKDDGRIILVGSSAAVTGSSQLGVSGLAYAAAKSGLVGLMRTFVSTLAERRITINIVAPGPVDHTDFFPDGHLPERIVSIYDEQTPLADFASAENVAAAIDFLASSAASATTGEILNVSAGLVQSR